MLRPLGALLNRGAPPPLPLLCLPFASAVLVICLSLPPCLLLLSPLSLDTLAAFDPPLFFLPALQGSLTGAASSSGGRQMRCPRSNRATMSSQFICSPTSRRRGLAMTPFTTPLTVRGLCRIIITPLLPLLRQGGGQAHVPATRRSLLTPACRLGARPRRLLGTPNLDCISDCDASSDPCVVNTCFDGQCQGVQLPEGATW